MRECQSEIQVKQEWTATIYTSAAITKVHFRTAFENFGVMGIGSTTVWMLHHGVSNQIEWMRPIPRTRDTRRVPLENNAAHSILQTPSNYHTTSSDKKDLPHMPPQNPSKPVWMDYQSHQTNSEKKDKRRRRPRVRSTPFFQTRQETTESMSQDQRAHEIESAKEWLYVVGSALCNCVDLNTPWL